MIQSQTAAAKPSGVNSDVGNKWKMDYIDDVKARAEVLVFNDKHNITNQEATRYAVGAYNKLNEEQKVKIETAVEKVKNKNEEQRIEKMKSEQEQSERIKNKVKENIE